VNEQFNITDLISASSGASSSVLEAFNLGGNYVVSCRDAEGNLKWQEEIKNVVTTAGRNDLLDKYLAGSTYTAAWYIGLISSVSYTGVPVLADTSASHGTWTEDATYSNGTRPAATFASASGGNKATSSASVFNINGTATIKGCFLISNSTKSGTTGILYSAGLFSGDKPVSNTDTLSVSYTAQTS
jgi:hypothetical protein